MIWSTQEKNNKQGNKLEAYHKEKQQCIHGAKT
jgi:hypothetical protein